MSQPENSSRQPDGANETEPTARIGEAVNHVNNALQVILGATLGDDPRQTHSEPWAILSEQDLAAVRRRLSAAVQLLLALAPGQLVASSLTPRDAADRITAGESFTVATTDDGITCTRCQQPLVAHPLEYGRDGYGARPSRYICIDRAALSKF